VVSDDGRHAAGAVISPLLANEYLHYVFDLWVEAWRAGRQRAGIWCCPLR
jgi:hypothetical protein